MTAEPPVKEGKPMMTLKQELELAAELAEGAGRKTGTPAAIAEGNLFASRLRRRIERIDGLRAIIGKGAFATVADFCDALVGDL